MLKSRNEIVSIIRLIDFTSLNTADTTTSILQWIKIIENKPQNLWPAAVCVYPNFGELVKKTLNIKVAVVGGCFPSAQTFPEIKFEELREIEKLGIDEVDVVINVGALLEDDFETAKTEIETYRQILTNKTLKVILETGELKDERLIQKASEIAIHAGANFIKTSTGKTEVGATDTAVKAMCEAIKHHYNNTGKKIGIKPSGGIRELVDAVKYLDIIKEILGEEWLSPELTRIGASNLYTNLLAKV